MSDKTPTRAECDKGYAALFGAHQQMVTERDTLRLEVQRLKDASFEAQDRYAALEAERDALQIRVKSLVDHSKLLESRLDAQTKYGAEANANARAEKYLAVIKAKDLELAYVAAARNASIKSFVAMAEAGLPLDGRLEEASHE